MAKIDYVKILEVVLPIIATLISNKVKKNKTNLYKNAAEACDTALDSLQDLAIKIVSDSNSPTIELDKQNFMTGVKVAEATLSSYKDRLDLVKKISKLYEENKIV